MFAGGEITAPVSAFCLTCAYVYCVYILNFYSFHSILYSRLLVDEVSLGFVNGAKVDFTEDLIRRSFEVIDNPNAEAGCGCGASFAAKNLPGDDPF